MQPERPHGVKTTFNASRRRKSSSPSAKRSSGSTVGSGTSRSSRSASGLRHVRRRGRARAEHRELAPVDVGRRDRARVGEDEHGAAGGEVVERRLDSAAPAEDGGVHRAVRRARPLAAGRRRRRRPRRRAARARRRRAARRSRCRRRGRVRAGRASRPARTQASGSTIVPLQSGQCAGRSTVPCAFTRSAKPPGRIVGAANRSQSDSCPARQRSHSPHEAWWTSATRRPSAVSATTS